MLGKSINVYLTEGGPGFMRLSNAIEQATKDVALAKLKVVFEAGKLFNDIDMVKLPLAIGSRAAMWLRMSQSKL